MKELRTCAFGNCDGLEAVDMSQTQVADLGTGTFKGCKNLRSVKLPQSLSYISHGAFTACEKLIEVNIPKELTEIGFRAFYKTGIESITFPPKLEEICGGAFAECINLHTVRFTSDIENINIYYEAFKNCTNLQNLIYPGNFDFTNKHHPNAFDGCNMLDKIQITMSKEYAEKKHKKSCIGTVLGCFIAAVLCLGAAWLYQKSDIAAPAEELMIYFYALGALIALLGFVFTEGKIAYRIITALTFTLSLCGIVFGGFIRNWWCAVPLMAFPLIEAVFIAKIGYSSIRRDGLTWINGLIKIKVIAFGVLSVLSVAHTAFGSVLGFCIPTMFSLEIHSVAPVLILILAVGTVCTTVFASIINTIKSMKKV